MSKPTTVSDALAHAETYWDANDRRKRMPGPRMMPIRAGRCADILGRSRKLSTLTASDGVNLLVGLRNGGLARSTVASYYAAGKRMLALSGRSTVDWPKAPTPERKVREPVKEAEVEACLSALLSRGWEDTANLIRFMRDTGARVHVEALYGTLSTDGKRLTIRDGKGGHERVIPFRDNVPAFGGLTYEGHLRRIKEVTHLRPHDLRRYFITKVYERSGKDLRMAQVLAGHADPTTTARYIGVSLEDMERALSAPPSG